MGTPPWPAQSPCCQPRNEVAPRGSQVFAHAVTVSDRSERALAAGRATHARDHDPHPDSGTFAQANHSTIVTTQFNTILADVCRHGVVELQMAVSNSGRIRIAEVIDFVKRRVASIYRNADYFTLGEVVEFITYAEQPRFGLLKNEHGEIRWVRAWFMHEQLHIAPEAKEQRICSADHHTWNEGDHRFPPAFGRSLTLKSHIPATLARNHEPTRFCSSTSTVPRPRIRNLSDSDPVEIVEHNSTGMPSQPRGRSHRHGLHCRGIRRAQPQMVRPTRLA